MKLEESLKGYTVRALIWNSLSQGGSQFIYLVTGIVLARLLSPTDFGLIGMLSIFIVLSTTLLDSGFGTALIRKSDCTETDFNTVFYFNIFFSILLYIILYLLAPAIASFFKQPDLKVIARVIFLGFVFNAFGVIHQAILLISIKNKALTFTNLASLLLSSIVAIVIAIRGHSVWALVAQAVLLSISKTAMLWIFSSWRPKLLFSFRSLLEILPFSVNLTLSKALSAFFANVYTFALGRFYIPQMVGYYVQASKWSDMGSQTIYISVQSAAFQLFSKIKDDNERLVRAFRKTIRFTSFLVFPILLGAILVAKLLIIILLTEKWLASVELFKWLCLGGILTAFTSLNYIFLQIKGRTDIILKLEAIKAAIAILVLALTLNAGILVITIAQVALRLLFMLVTLKVSGKQVNYPLLLQLKDMTPYLIISMVMLLIAYPFQYLFTNDLAILAVQVIVAVTFYLFINHIMKSNVLQDIWLFLTKRSI